MESEKDLDKMLKDLLEECEQNRKIKSSMTDLFVVMMCTVLLKKTAHDKILHAAAKKKVLSELQKTDIYKEYIKNLKTKN